MQAEIISVGTELLLGDIVNTNTAFLAKELAALGINIYHQQVVGDNLERIKAAFGTAYSRGADLVITTGGLGPTEDDITGQAAAAFFGRPLVFHTETWTKIEEHFDRAGNCPTENNRRSAYISEGAQVFDNPAGTAPGQYIEDDARKMLLLPGPPAELTSMFEQKIVPFLRCRTERTLFSSTLKIVGMGESLVEDTLGELTAAEDPTVALYAKTGEVWIRLTAAAADLDGAHRKIAPFKAKLYDLLGDNIYAEDGDTMAGVAAKLLRERGFKLSCAESCTGGLLTAQLVAEPGISDILVEGLITYSNESKTARLGVHQSLLGQYGAVSPAVAAAMAEGAANAARGSGMSGLSGIPGMSGTSGTSRAVPAIVGLSTTGIAGPDGGTEEKPVGLVYLGLAIPGKKTLIKKLLLTGGRNKIRSRAALLALDFLRRELTP